MRNNLTRLLKRKNDRLDNVKTSFIFRDPLRITEQKSRRLDHLLEKMELLHPGNRLKQSRKDLELKTEKLNDYFKRVFDKKQNSYFLTINKLELLNPLSIMKKGYSVSKKDGLVIKSIKDVNVNDNIDVLVSDGVITTKVTSTRKGE